MPQKRFMHSKTIRQDLSEQEKIQLPFFTTAALAVLGIFVFIMLALFSVGVVESALFMVFGMFFMLLAFLFFRKGEIKKGSSMATIGFLVAQSIVTFFLDFGTNPYGLYRILALALFLFLAKYLLSSSIREIVAYAFVATTMFVSKSIMSYKFMSEEDITTYVACIAISLVCLVSSTILFVALFKMFSALNAYADKEKNNVKNALQQITGVLTESKQGLEVGHVLSQETENATIDLQKMAHVFSTLQTSANDLSQNILAVLDLFTTIEKNSAVMQEGTKSQNSSITESSVALTEISTNLSSVNEIASQRSQNMNSLLESLQNQKTLVQEALQEVQKVKESSTSIGDFIHTVEDIANQTGLLAMNASIEAAHAGAAGKGFAVIAQEIRKLSEETSKNAAYIGDVLKGNEQTVESAANAVISFASQAEKSTEELQGTIAALDGILMGIAEMDIGTRGVMNSMQSIVEASRTNGEIVDDVSGKIVQQREIMDNISVFAKTLQEEVSSANTQITNVQGSLATIKTTSDQNVQVSSSVNQALENIDV